MRLIFFSKCSKFNVNSKNGTELQQNVFGFLDDSIGIGSGKFSLFLGEYSYSAIKVLTGSPKISDLTKN